jgi:uncharacterized protein (DUF4415 family)
MRKKYMKITDSFPFERAHKATPAELRFFRKAYENTYGEKFPKRGRPPKGEAKYRDVHIKLHPKALEWARAKAKSRGIGYQTLINEVLLHHAAD